MEWCSGGYRLCIIDWGFLCLCFFLWFFLWFGVWCLWFGGFFEGLRGFWGRGYILGGWRWEDGDRDGDRDRIEIEMVRMVKMVRMVRMVRIDCENIRGITR